METATMNRISREKTERRQNWSEWSMTILHEGIFAGTISGAVVALWYLLCDVIGGQPFHTPALLGTIFFRGLQVHDAGAGMLAPVLAFTTLHFAAFIAFGLATALLIAAAEREPLLLFGALMVYACYEVSFLAFVAVLDGSALGAIGWWKIAAANVITVVMVFGYFHHRHPEILARFYERWEHSDTEPVDALTTPAAQVIEKSEVGPRSLAS
jgi:hypothetical protein